MSNKLPAVVQGGSASLSNASELDDKRPRAFKFGHVDQNLLMSRLYSTPLKKEATQAQKFALDNTSYQKPVIRKLEAPLPKPEPIVI
jgi:hypothetical protein